MSEKPERLDMELKRLADHELVMQEGGTSDIDRAIRVMNKQANEIERLRVCVRDEWDAVAADKILADAEAKDAEIERLRKELHAVKDISDDYHKTADEMQAKEEESDE